MIVYLLFVEKVFPVQPFSSRKQGRLADRPPPGTLRGRNYPATHEVRRSQCEKIVEPLVSHETMNLRTMSTPADATTFLANYFSTVFACVY